MATPVQIKRSTTTAIPVSLANGELAYSSNGGKLYIGDPANDTILAIGGIENPGTLTANHGLVVNSTSGINLIWANALNIGTSTTNVTVNATTFTGISLSANNSSYLGGTAAASYQLNSTLAANVATITANNSSNFAGQSQSFYANVTNPILTGNLTIGTSANQVYANITTITLGNVSISATVNSTIYTGQAWTANNAINLGGATAASYQLNSTLAANVATMTANNSTNFAGQNQAWYANASAPVFSTSVNVGSNVNLTTSTFTILANAIVNSTVNTTQNTIFNGSSLTFNYWNGNTTVNTNSNTFINSSSISVGNTLNSTNIYSTYITVGANVVHNLSSIYVMSNVIVNTTVNTTQNTILTGTSLIFNYWNGNATVNTNANTAVNSSMLSMGNSTVLSVNLTSGSGGSLTLGSNTITTAGINAYAAPAAGDATIYGYANGLGAAVQGNTISGYGVQGTATDGYGGSFVSSTGDSLITGNGTSAFLIVYANGQVKTTFNMVIGAAAGSGANLLIGNSSVFMTINSTAISGSITNAVFATSANSAAYLGAFAAAAYVQNTDSRTLSGNLTFTGANHVISSANLNISSNVVVTGALITATSANLSIQNITVSGNLIIGGSLTSINTSHLIVNDNFIEMGDNNLAADAVDTGWFAPSGNATTIWYSGMARIASLSTNNNAMFWLFTSNTNPNTSLTVDSSANTSTSTLKAYLAPWGAPGAFIVNSTNITITGNSTIPVAIAGNTLSLSTALAYASGGTGLSTIAVSSLLIGNTTAYSSLTVGSTGQVLQVSGTTVIWGALDGGSY